MFRKVKAFTIVGVCLTLCACAGPSNGIVHNKDYTPAHTIIITQCTLAGKTTICTPVPEYIGDEWQLDIYASTSNHGWVDVDQHTYDTCNIGDYYKDGNCG